MTLANKVKVVSKFYDILLAHKIMPSFLILQSAYNDWKYAFSALNNPQTLKPKFLSRNMLSAGCYFVLLLSMIGYTL